MSIELEESKILRVLNPRVSLDVVRLAESPSTNDEALAGSGEKRVLYWTPRQTSGRGRGCNVWESSEGCLTFSYLEPRVDLSPELVPQVSLLAALAMGDALRSLVSVRLKWPNDVYLLDKKLCGILVERHRSGGLVVGVGLNVANDVSAIQPPAIHLQGALGKNGEAVDSNVIVGRWINHFVDLLELLRDGDLRLAEVWRPHCWLTGQKVELESGERGTCLGLAPDGGLRVRTTDGSERLVHGGVVVPARIEGGSQGV